MSLERARGHSSQSPVASRDTLLGCVKSRSFNLSAGVASLRSSLSSGFCLSPARCAAAGPGHRVMGELTMADFSACSFACLASFFRRLTSSAVHWRRRSPLATAVFKLVAHLQAPLLVVGLFDYQIISSSITAGGPKSPPSSRNVSEKRIPRCPSYSPR